MTAITLLLLRIFVARRDFSSLTLMDINMTVKVLNRILKTCLAVKIFKYKMKQGRIRDYSQKTSDYIIIEKNQKRSNVFKNPASFLVVRQIFSF